MKRPTRTSRTPRALPIAAALLGLLGGTSAHALSLCVSNVAQLDSAFVIGQIQSEPLTIMLTQGFYQLDAAVAVEFSAPTTIEGGYTANCASRVVNAANTVVSLLNGTGMELRQVDASPYARLTLDGFTIGNTNQYVFLQAGRYGDFSNDPGRLTLRGMAFRQIGRGVQLQDWDDSVTIENTLFEHIGASDTCGVSIRTEGGADVRVNHMTADLSNGKNFCVFDDDDEDATVSIYNSILWGSDGGQPIFSGTLSPETPIAIVNTIFHSQFTLGDVSIVNQINADPRWVDPANGNYLLKTSPLSPAINSATFASPGGEPSTDIEGHLRVIGSAPDRGAYESPYNDQSVLTVANTNDSGTGSLRQALLDANSTPAIAKQIRFDIRNAQQVSTCPAVIAPATTLPPINATIAINGYTQGPSSPNSDPDAFNAATCIVLKPASTLSYAFLVPAAAPANVAFNLRGVAIGGFSQPVVIQGGSNHVVAGNQFGGTALGVNLPGASINAISIGVNAGGSFVIGGPSVADRNVIVDAEFSGINVQSTVDSTPDECQVVNNLIGLKPDGHTALANNVGIHVSGSGCGLFRNRIAGNEATNVWLEGDRNLMHQNVIGVGADGQGIANSATGVLVNGAGNVIGAGGSGGTLTANTIRFNQAGGVVIQGGTSVAGNSVNANLIYDNGPAGTGMDVDLQPTATAAGPTANDAGDLDNGPNRLQNFPVAKQLLYTGAGTVDRPATVSGVLDTVPGSYRIDMYFSDKANPIGRRGHAQIHLGRTTVVVPATGRGVFSMPITVPTQLAGGVISLTATDVVGNSSEVGSALPTDTIFADGIE